MWLRGIDPGDPAPAAEPVFGTELGEGPIMCPSPNAGLTGVFGSASMWPGGMKLTDSGPAALEFCIMPEGDMTIGPEPVGRPGPCSEPVIGAPLGAVVCPCVPVPCANQTDPLLGCSRCSLASPRVGEPAVKATPAKKAVADRRAARVFISSSPQSWPPCHGVPGGTVYVG